MSDNRFLANFILLSLVSGLTIGLGKIVTTLYALSLGATPFQIGMVSAMESIGMVIVTVPAGFIIARYGMRSVYFVASLGPLLVNLALPFSASWVALAVGRGLIGLCIPFRIVSMNSAFLERLKSLGQAKAGWYRGTLTGGMAIVGPAAATLLTQRLTMFACFLLVAALFGLMGLFSLSFMPVRQVQTEGAPGFLAELRLILSNDDIAESCLIEFLSSATNALFGTFIILLAIALPPLTEQDGIHVMLFQGVTAVAMLLLGGALVERFATRAAYALGLALASGALLTFGLAGGFAGLAFGAVLLSAGSAVVHLVNVRMLAALPGGKSKVAGLYNLASMLGSSFGAIAGGLATRIVPLQSIYLIWLPILGVAALAVQTIHQRRSGIGALVTEAR
ncbi:MFS transporter [Sphingomonas oleivorans]|uniref:MFS transporter n=1 Tax=Sphingomonas oleivorans TaxID=1735121 RepID=A0A2T5FTZ3_9SPHN|nr:MFS transporter [Sphingomonas oleivorans]PTQ07750.1 MFS transporter [Sphingomonas oleivorans]